MPEKPDENALVRLTAEPRFLIHGTVTGRYLSVLRFLWEQHGEEFAAVLEMRGRRRVYFARKREEIETGSEHTFPRPIPGSPYWALTNLNNQQKSRVLERIISALGYSHGAADRVIRALDQGIKRWTRGTT